MSYSTTSLLAAALSLIGCTGELEPCEGVVDGATYQVQVGQPMPNEDMPECHKAWGLPEATTFSARVVELTGEADCKVGVPELTELDGWTFERRPMEALSDGFLEGEYDAAFGDCQARVSLRISAVPEEGLPCVTDGRQSGVCLLSLILDSRGGTACPTFCGTRLSATLTRR